MKLPWLKSLLFWAILIVCLIFIFQCTQNSENEKLASESMFERLYQCTKELNPKSHQSLIVHIKSTINLNSNQKELMQLIHQCRQARPLKQKNEYINLIQNLK